VLTSQRVDELYACPFCRQLFARGEVTSCPECDLVVRPLAELPPSHEAQLLDEPEDPTPPEDETLPWSYLGRGRGPLSLLALVGMAVFFAPWVHELAPEIQTLSGYELSLHLAWVWAGGIAWFIMLPLVATRRTIRQMRGARVAVGFLAAMVLLTVATRLSVSPTPNPLIPIRYAWGWGIYAAGGLSALALALAFRFGGTLADMPTQQPRPGDETLH
jgi:hypothetical protein